MPRRTILIVDDSKALTDALALMLEQGLSHHDMRCIVRTDPSSALHAFNLRTPDVVIVDYHLGTTTGVSLISQLRAKGYDGLILAMSAHEDELPRKAMLTAGADRFISKSKLFTSMTIVEVHLNASPRPTVHLP